MNRRFFVCFYRVVIGILLATSSFAANTENAQSALGTNLQNVKSYTPEWIFVDQFLRVRDWIAGSCDGRTWNTNQSFNVDENGFVKSAPSGVCPHTMVLDNHYKSDYPAGTYVVLWEGNDNFKIFGDAKNFTKTAPGRATFEVTSPSSGGVRLQTLPDGSLNYAKNFRILMPGGVCGTSIDKLDYFRGCQTSRGGEGSCGTDETCFDFEEVYFNRFADSASEMNKPKVVFHPTFLQKLKKYSVIRFMDWGETNDSPLEHWSDRPTLQTFTQTLEKGVAYEYMIALSNVLNADPWFTLPHKATNDYVTKLAQLVVSTLNPNLKPYIEYTNEAWNGMFSQAKYVQDKGVALGLASSSKSYLAGRRYFSERTVQIAEIFRNVFGANQDRIIAVMGSHAANNWVSSQQLSWEDANTKVQALAIAPYFGGYIGRKSESATWTLNQLFQEIFSGGVLSGGPSGGALENSFSWMRSQKAIADQYSVDLVAYEGGQHLVGVGSLTSDSRLTSLLTSANGDSRIAQAYTQYLQEWKNIGGKAFVHFNNLGTWNKWGSWGSFRYQTQPRVEAPKYDALMSFVEATACWWTGCERFVASPTPQEPTPEPAPEPTPEDPIQDDPAVIAATIQTTGNPVAQDKWTLTQDGTSLGKFRINTDGSIQYTRATIASACGDGSIAPNCPFTWNPGADGSFYQGMDYNFYPAQKGLVLPFKDLRSVDVTVKQELLTGNFSAGGMADCGLGLAFGNPTQAGPSMDMNIGGRGSVGDNVRFLYRISNQGEDSFEVDAYLNRASDANFNHWSVSQFKRDFNITTQTSRLTSSGDYIEYRMSLKIDHANNRVKATITPISSNKDLAFMQPQTVVWQYDRRDDIIDRFTGENRGGIMFDHNGAVQLTKAIFDQTNVGLGFVANGAVKGCTFRDVVVNADTTEEPYPLNTASDSYRPAVVQTTGSDIDSSRWSLASSGYSAGKFLPAENASVDNVFGFVRNATQGPCVDGSQAPNCPFSWNNGNQGQYQGMDYNFYPGSGDFIVNRLADLRSVSAVIRHELVTGNFSAGGMADCGIAVAIGQKPGTDRGTYGDNFRFLYRIGYAGQDSLEIDANVNYITSRRFKRWSVSQFAQGFNVTNPSNALTSSGDFIEYRMTLDFDHSNSQVKVTIEPIRSNKGAATMQKQTAVWNFNNPYYSVDPATGENRGGLVFDHGGRSELRRAEFNSAPSSIGFSANGAVGSCQFREVQIVK